MFALLLMTPAFADDPLLGHIDEEAIHWSDLDGVGERHVDKSCPYASPGCIKQARQEVFGQWLTIQLSERALEDAGLPVTEPFVDGRIADVATSLKLDTVDDLRVKVEADGMPWEVYRRSMRDTLVEARMAQFLQLSGIQFEAWMSWAMDRYGVDLTD